MSKKSKSFNKPLSEKVSEFILNKLRKFSIFNSYENEVLSNDYEAEVQLIKEQNSKTVWDAYYMPMAQKAILEEQGFLPTEKTATPRATAMLMKDMAEGVLDDWYRFTLNGGV